MNGGGAGAGPAGPSGPLEDSGFYPKGCGCPGGLWTEEMKDLTQVLTGALWWLMSGGQTVGLSVGARLLEQVMMGFQVVCAHFSMDVLLLGSVHEPGCTSPPKDQALHPPCSSSVQGRRVDKAGVSPGCITNPIPACRRWS